MHFLNPFISMQMKKSQLQVTKAYYSKAVKATVQKQHSRNKKKCFEYMCCCCTVIYNWVGKVILIKQYADKGRTDAYMDKTAFADPCVGPQMRFLK